MDIGIRNGLIPDKQFSASTTTEKASWSRIYSRHNGWAPSDFKNLSSLPSIVTSEFLHQWKVYLQVEFNNLRRVLKFRMQTDKIGHHLKVKSFTLMHKMNPNGWISYIDYGDTKPKVSQSHESTSNYPQIPNFSEISQGVWELLAFEI